jgi:hypothetical protein
VAGHVLRVFSGGGGALRSVWYRVWTGGGGGRGAWAHLCSQSDGLRRNAVIQLRVGVVGAPEESEGAKDGQALGGGVWVGGGGG